jgi:hypothetical protein
MYEIVVDGRQWNQVSTGWQWPLLNLSEFSGGDKSGFGS